MPLPRVDLATLVRDAAAGRFPPADGRVSRTRPWRAGIEAAVAFTGHAVLCVGEDVSDEELLRLGAHGFGGAHDPRVTTALAGAGEIGVLDVLLARPDVAGGAGSPGTRRQVDERRVEVRADVPGLVPRPDLADGERAAHARQWRDDVRVLGLTDRASTGLVTLSRGIAGLTEIGLQATDGSAEPLLRGALALVPADDPVLASVTPGNARSLRFFLRQGFVPVASVQQWHPARDSPADHCGP